MTGTEWLLAVFIIEGFAVCILLAICVDKLKDIYGILSRR
jgi:hypothetical protein